MAAPVLLSSTYNATSHVLVLTWDQTVTFTGGQFDIQFTDLSGVVWGSDNVQTGNPQIYGAVMTVLLIPSGQAAGPNGTVHVAAGVVENGSSEPSAIYAGFSVTTYGGAIPTTGVPTIGTYDEYVNVYSVNSNQLAAGATQAQVQGFIDAVNMLAARFCGIAFTNSGNTQQTFTEVLNGDGSDTIRVRNTPVISITSITVTNPDTTTQVLDSTTYACELTTGTIKRTVPSRNAYIFDYSSEFAPMVSVGVSNYFPEGWQNISVVYLGAYTTAPADLRWAIYETVDESLARVGIRGLKDLPNSAEIRDSLIRRLRPFERIVM